MPSVKVKPTGKGNLFDIATTSLRRLYSTFTDDSFEKDLTERISNYQFKDAELGEKGTIREVARRNGLEDKLDAYIQKDILGGTRGKLIKAMDGITSAKDVFEKGAEAVEVAVTIGAGVPTAGAGAVATQAGATAIELPGYLALAGAYHVIMGVLGYPTGVYKLKNLGTDYIADTGVGLGKAGLRAVPVIGTLSELVLSDDMRPRIAEAKSGDAADWLRNELRKAKSMPPIPSESLYIDDVVKRLAAPSTRKAMKKEDLADYLKMLDSATCYGSDLASKPAYKAAA